MDYFTLLQIILNLLGYNKLSLNVTFILIFSYSTTFSQILNYFFEKTNHYNVHVRILLVLFLKKKNPLMSVHGQHKKKTIFSQIINGIK